MGVTERIVLILIAAGVLTLVIWLVRALSSYPQDEAAQSPGGRVARDLTGATTPPKLSWNWGAFFLGPIWYLLEGLWVHAIIMTTLLLLSGAILLPFVMLYSGLKANETLADKRLAQHSFY
ncbi:MAG TPA: DUF2628 domain-containing protein [bacterium]|nr:DUF2628 domain-containing protein [bacterium]